MSKRHLFLVTAVLALSACVTSPAFADHQPAGLSASIEHSAGAFGVMPADAVVASHAVHSFKVAYLDGAKTDGFKDLALSKHLAEQVAAAWRSIAIAPIASTEYRETNYLRLGRTCASSTHRARGEVRGTGLIRRQLAT